MITISKRIKGWCNWAQKIRRLAIVRWPNKDLQWNFCS